MREYLDAIGDLLDAGRAAALATIVAAQGSTPRAVGARMIVPADGEPLFTLGGGSFEAEVIADARAALETGVPRLKTYSLADRGPQGDGQDCGGSVTVYLEPLGRADRLWIFGAGHVGRALAAASRGLGFDVTVFDDRGEFADAGRLPGARRVVRTDSEFREGLGSPDSATYCAVLTRSHRTDKAALRACLVGDAAWVGMIGSARKRLAIFRELREEGVPQARLESVECPIGLPIEAETPEEIAISILASVIRARRTRSAPVSSRPIP